LKKNQEREGKIFAKKKALNSQTYFAFGSCTPRMGYSISGSGGRSDSGHDVMRSTSSTNMANMSQSMYSTSSSSRHHDREHQVNHQRRSSEREMNGGSGAKRATSVHALDQSAEIDAEGDTTFHHSNSNSGSASAHRRRTDLMPTITFSTASPAGHPAGVHGGTGNGYSRSSTPGNRMLRSPAKHSDMKSKRPVTKSASADHKDDTESATRSTKTPSRKTPAQVKAESAARKAKASTTKSPTPPLKKQNSRDSMEKQSSNSSKESSVEKEQEIISKPEVEPEEAEPEVNEEEMTAVVDQDTGNSEETHENTEVPTETHPVREATPDIIRKSPVKEVVAIDNIEDQTPKKIISSEEEAKARIAEKRREMKEKKEREAELERQRQAERIEAERKAK